MKVSLNNPGLSMTSPHGRSSARQRHLAHKKTPPRTTYNRADDPPVGLILGPYGGPEGGRFLMSEGPLQREIPSKYRVFSRTRSRSPLGPYDRPTCITTLVLGGEGAPYERGNPVQVYLADEKLPPLRTLQ